MSVRNSWAASAFAALVLSAANHAAAFSDFERFDESADVGGGGGRFFTGSPVDGFTCAVCHRGGTEPSVRVLGLPVDGFVPGQSYDVEVQWSDPALSHALALEVINRAGGDAGNLQLFEGSAVAASEQCSADSGDGGKRASFITKAGARRVVAIEDCGASSVRFRFTAPNERDVAFALTAVRSDLSGTAEGDGVTELSRLLYRQGDEPAAGGCSVQPGPQGSPWSFAAGLVLLGLLVRRRR